MPLGSQFARKVGDHLLPRPWSKHSDGSTAHKKLAESTAAVAGEEDARLSAKDLKVKKGKDGKHSAVDEAVGKCKLHACVYVCKRRMSGLPYGLHTSDWGAVHTYAHQLHASSEQSPLSACRVMAASGWMLPYAYASPGSQLSQSLTPIHSPLSLLTNMLLCTMAENGAPTGAEPTLHEFFTPKLKVT